MPIQCERDRNPALVGQPVVLVDGNHNSIEAASSEATRLGVRRGMSLSRANALSASLVVLPHSPALYHDHNRQLIAHLGERFPRIASPRQGVYYVDLRGMSHLFADMGDLDACFTPIHLHVQERYLGVGATAFVAYAAATTHPDHTLHVPPDKSAAFLAPLPVSLLPFSPPTAARLRDLGITHIEDFLSIPLTSWLAYMGNEARFCWNLATASSVSSLTLAPHEEEISTSWDLDPPLDTTFGLDGAVYDLVVWACTQLSSTQQGAKNLHLSAISHNDTLIDHLFSFPHPLRAVADIWPLVHSYLSSHPPTSPIIRLSLSLENLCLHTSEQACLAIPRSRYDPRLEEALTHITTRFGGHAITQIVEDDPCSRIPERRHHLSTVIL